MAATSSPVSVKSKMSRLSAMCRGLSVLGKVTLPSWMCQRSTTWAAVLPYLAAGPVRAGSARSVLSPWPSGYQASKTTPVSARAALRACWFQYGWASTWRTAGAIRATSRISWTFAAEKFDRPMERTLPASTASSMALQAETYSP